MSDDDDQDYSHLQSEQNRKQKKAGGWQAMGSGKTAAFVIPMLQRLKRRDTKGIRALLVSPTRELALQTFKVVKELGRFTGLRCAILVGGDAIEDQFSTIHENPDMWVFSSTRIFWMS
ncbi:unnamed protein product [Heligmosomoides polygyrus]|uniref:ATP-dependent RNA helicase n=1 Tax=Heligmosomoides polygyrus TaxID=6339 RepID=A0A183G4Z6_HELPZ|nr:unnamed protein product [Heligmosomoides polygyrus]